MGYSTDFVGELKFKKELLASQLAKIKSMLGEDCRDHPEWNGSDGLYSINLELLEDFDGIKWNGWEKTHGMVEVVNLIISEMKKNDPEFGLIGEFNAQGEDMHDIWKLIINKKGLAEKVELKPVGKEIECPHCKKKDVFVCCVNCEGNFSINK